MSQSTFADLEYEGKKRKTRREKFLERMECLIPWEELEERIRPFYPKAGRGRQPYELSTMLRIHCVQLFYNLSDPDGGHALRGRVGETIRRSEAVWAAAGRDDDPELPPSAGGTRIGHGTVRGDQPTSGVSGSSSQEGTMEHHLSTKNRSKERDPEMHQTKKGNNFGMKVGVDSETGVVHSVSTTPANVHDMTETSRLLHGGETLG